MKRFFYKDCVIDVYVKVNATETSLTIDGYYAAVELPNESGCVNTETMPTKEAALFAGVQLAEKWRLDRD